MTMAAMKKTNAEGVFRKGRRFVALIYVRGERRFLGSYPDITSAIAKVTDITKRHEGEWAA